MQGEEETFPQEIKDFCTQKFKVTLKITPENINKESQVYEATDVYVEGYDQVLADESETIHSPSAEDDNSLIVIFIHLNSFSDKSFQ